KRAQESQKVGRFQKEIVGVEVVGPKGVRATVLEDEDPPRTNFEKIPRLKPAFEKNGTVTAANSSKISDGAAAFVITSAEHAREKGLKPLARIVAYGTFAKEPLWFTTAPTDVI